MSGVFSGRGDKLLSLCPGSSRPLYCIVKVLELDRWHMLLKTDVKYTNAKDLRRITLNRKEYHVIVLQTGAEIPPSHGLVSTSTAAATQQLASTPGEDQFEVGQEKTIRKRTEFHMGRKNRKGHCCKYCTKVVTNFSKHLLTCHTHENEVVSFTTASNTKEKLARLRRIMAEGDSYYNEQYPGMPIVRRISTAKREAMRDKCPNCKILVSRNHSVEHYRKCNPDLGRMTGKSVRVDLTRGQIHLTEHLSEDMKIRIIPLMRNDSVRYLCEHDKSLILYGNKMCTRLKGEGHEKTIRNHLRIAGRVAEKALQLHKHIDGSINSVDELFEPICYDSFVNAIYEICGYGQGVGEEMAKPTTPHQYGPRMKEVSDNLLTELLKKYNPANEGDEEQTSLKSKIDQIKAWQAIYDRDFDKQVASLGRKQADRRTYDIKQLTPSMDDVKRLINHVQDTTIKSYNSLKHQFSFEAYKTLTQCLLLRLWIFNRRRVGEVDKMRLQNWLRAKDIDEDSDQFKALSQTEQMCASSFRRLSVQGKLRRPASLLVPKKDMLCYEIIISNRNQAEITSDNVYLFATHDRYVEGTAVMSEYAKASGAQQWKLLTGTRLRKQLAASLRYLNLTDEDMRLVAEAMGHTEKTHLLNYRTHDAALHAGRVSKLLLAIDDGTIDKYKGKSLEDMDDSVVTETIQTSKEDLVNVDVDGDFCEGTGQEPLTPHDLPRAASEETSQVRTPSPQQYDQEMTPVKKVARKVKITNVFDSDDSTEPQEPQKRIRGNTPGRRRAYAKRKTHKNQQWSKPLKDALKIRFAEEMENKTCPSTARVLQVIEALEGEFPEIVNHSPKKVKTLVTNLMIRK